jgi:hypothetical protein
VAARPALRARLLLGALLLAALSDCTTVGMQTQERARIDYGPPLDLRVCFLAAPHVSVERVYQLVDAVNQEFEPYAITVVVPWVQPWTRAGFTEESLIDDVARRPLPAPCDRLVALVDRNAGDFFWGLLLPEVLGAVEDVTNTHGYVVANVGSLNQVFDDPGNTAVHEFYHLLGCPHAATLSECYHRIAELKRHVDPHADFVPGIAPDGRYLLTRDAANSLLKASLAATDAVRHNAPH